MKKSLAISLLLSGLIFANSGANAQTSPISTELTDEFGEYAYGGGYVWRTGMFGSYRHPRRILERECVDNGGRLEHVLRLERGSEASTVIGSSSYSIAPSDLWAWSVETFNAYSRKHDVSQTSFVVTFPRPDWAPVDAFGLFGCYMENRRDPEWLVAVMVHHPKLIVVREVTAELASHRLNLRQVQDLAERERTQQEEQREIEGRERATLARAAEDQRLAPWRAALNVGDRTNCGMVVEIRGPIVKVQLPANISLPSGEREFWIRRLELTDSKPITNCRF